MGYRTPSRAASGIPKSYFLKLSQDGPLFVGQLLSRNQVTQKIRVNSPPPPLSCRIAMTFTTLARRTKAQLTLQLSVESFIYTVPSYKIFPCVFGKHRSLVAVVFHLIWCPVVREWWAGADGLCTLFLKQFITKRTLSLYFKIS